MKIFICGMIIDTQKLQDKQIETTLQDRYDKWLGKDMVKVEVRVMDAKKIEFTFHRRYGSWYENPKNFSENNGCILDWDRQIILAENYFVGGQADFSKRESYLIIRESIPFGFMSYYKNIQRKNHLSRVKSIDYNECLDHFDLSIEVI